MEKLTKKQREILEYLDKIFPERTNNDLLAEKLGDKPDDILADIEMLYDKQFIKMASGTSSRYIAISISPKGKEKLQETFITRLKDTAWQNPWTVIAIVLPVVIAVISGLITWHYYSENLNLQKQIKQENELKQILPPTASLRQDSESDNFGELVITPTLYFKKNSDRLFTISNFNANFTLNGKQAGNMSVGGYPLKYETEELPYNINIKSAVYPILIDYSDVSVGFMNYSEFFHKSNDLVINYILEIKDMDSQIVYRGNVTTEIDSSISPPKNFSAGKEPILFNWTKI